MPYTEKDAFICGNNSGFGRGESPGFGFGDFCGHGFVDDQGPFENTRRNSGYERGTSTGRGTLTFSGFGGGIGLFENDIANWGQDHECP